MLHHLTSSVSVVCWMTFIATSLPAQLPWYTRPNEPAPRSSPNFIRVSSTVSMCGATWLFTTDQPLQQQQQQQQQQRLGLLVLNFPLYQCAARLGC
jgi:hypothetical protein